MAAHGSRRIDTFNAVRLGQLQPQVRTHDAHALGSPPTRWVEPTSGVRGALQAAMSSSKHAGHQARKTLISPTSWLQVLAAAIDHAKAMRYCAKGDSIVALHRIGNASVIKIVDIK